MRKEFSPFRLLRETFRDWWEDKALRLAAALAYYAVFSIAPLIVLTESVAGRIFGPEAVRGQLDDQLIGFVGEKSAETLQSMVRSASRKTEGAWAILGGLTLLIAAGGVFGQLKDALNTVWEVQPRPGRGIGGFIRDRFLSFTMVLGTGFLLLVSLIISTVLAVATRHLESIFPLAAALWWLIHFIVSMGVVTLLFAMIFRYLPDVKIEWRDVWIGAAATALLFNLGKYLLGFYLGREALVSAYGMAGAGILILLWVYYASLILLFGAEFTQVYARARGSKMVPRGRAKRVDTDKRRQEGLAC
jgi:membrane protein